MLTALPTGTLALCVFPFLARWANRDWSRFALQSAPMFFAALHWFELLLERDAVSRLSGYVLWKPVLAVVGPMCFAAFAVWLYTTGHRRKALLLRMCLGIGFLGLGWALDGTYVKFASASWLISGLLLFTHPLRLAGAKRLACLYVVASIPLFFISKLSTTYNQHGICSPLYWSIETVKQRLGISDDNRQSFKPDAAYRKQLIRRYSVPKGGASRDVKHVLLVVLESIGGIHGRMSLWHPISPLETSRHVCAKRRCTIPGDATAYGNVHITNTIGAGSKSAGNHIDPWTNCRVF